MTAAIVITLISPALLQAGAQGASSAANEGLAVSSQSDTSADRNGADIYGGAPKAASYTVVFSGEGQQDQTLTVEENATIAQAQVQSPAPPSGKGAFLGWFYGNGLQTKFEFDSTQVTGAMQLTAVFEEPSPTLSAIHRVTFAVEATTFTEDVAEGDVCPEPANPALPAGMTAFIGWYTDAGEQYTFSAPVTQSFKLTAKFRDTYFVHFLDGPEGASAQVIDTKEVKRGTYAAATDKTVTPPDPGMVFQGKWMLNGVLFDFGTTAVTGNITLTPYFENTFYIYFVSFGTPVNPQVVVQGGKAALPAAPARAGYVFKHWSLNENGAEFVFADTPIAGTTILYAVWEAEPADYTVMYWLEKPNLPFDFDKTDSDNYRFAYAETKQETTGATVTIEAANANSSNNATLKYGELYRGSSGVVKGDGSTVINVYFTRKIYNLVMDLNRDPNYYDASMTLTLNGRTTTYTNETGADRYTIRAKYEMDIGDLWPVMGTGGNVVFDCKTKDGVTTYLFEGWNNSYENVNWVSKRFTLTSDMIDGSDASGIKVANASWSTVAETVNLNYMFEALDQNSPAGGVLHKGVWYLRSEEYSQTVSTSGSIFNLKNIFGMLEADGEKALAKVGDEFVSTTSFVNDQYLFYGRIRYSLSYVLRGGEFTDGTAVVQNDVPYGMLLEAPADPVKAGSQFGGWYLDSDYTIPYTFGGASVMKNRDMRLFAKWTGGNFTARFYLSEEDMQNEANVYKTITIPADNKLENPNLFSIGEATAYGVFKGWNYYVPGTTVVVKYAFGSPVNRDVNLFADFKTDGFRLTYSGVPGVVGTLPADDKEYRYNVLAPVQNGDGLSVQGNDQKVFTAWTKDDGVDTALYYPGTTVTMSDSFTLYPRFIDSTKAAKVTYNENLGTAGSKTSTITVEQNVDFTLASAQGLGFAKEGHELVGWAFNAEGTGARLTPGQLYKTDARQTTLFAVWQKTKHTVTFVSDGNGTLGGKLSFSGIEWGTLWASAGIQLPTIAANQKYYFDRWDTLPAEIKGDITIKAYFVRQTDITLTSAAGTAVYDGKTHSVQGYTSSVSGLDISGISAGVTGTNAGSYTAVFSGKENLRILRGAEDVTYKYYPAFVEGTLVIQPMNITIAPKNSGMTYGDTFAAGSLSAAVSPAAPADGDALQYTLACSPGKNAGQYTISVVPGANPNYNITAGTGTFTVSPRPATVTPNNKTIQQGDADPALDAVETNVLPGDKLVYTLQRDAGSAAGQYAIRVVAKAGDNPNYTLTTNNGLLTITAGATGSPSQPPASASSSAVSRSASRPVSSSSASASSVASGSQAESASAESASISASGVVEVPDNPVPEGGAPKGHWSLLNMIAAGIGAVIAVLLLVGAFVGRGKEGAGQGSGSTIWRVLAILCGVALPVVFFLTQNLGGTMNVVDSWTPLMLILLLAQIVLLVLMRTAQRRQGPDEQEPAK